MKKKKINFKTNIYIIAPLIKTIVRVTYIKHDKFTRIFWLVDFRDEYVTRKFYSTRTKSNVTKVTRNFRKTTVKIVSRYSKIS